MFGCKSNKQCQNRKYLVDFIQDHVIFFLSMQKKRIQKEYEWCLEQTILKDGQPWDANMILDDQMEFC